MNSQAQELSEYKRQIEAQIRKNHDLVKENENLKEVKKVFWHFPLIILTFLKVEEEKNEKRINDLLQRFQKIQNEQVDAGELEREVNKLKLENLQLKEHIESVEEKNQSLCKEMEEYIVSLENTINENEEKFSEDLRLKGKEIGALKQNNAALEDQLYNTNKKLEEFQGELDNLANTLSEVYQRENQYKLALSELEQMNSDLKEELEQLEDQNRIQINHLKNECSKQQEAVENLEVERKRIQDELDILSQTNNYHVNELEEKKILILDLKQQVLDLRISLFLISLRLESKRR